jgi:hypothetical protein
MISTARPIVLLHTPRSKTHHKARPSRPAAAPTTSTFILTTPAATPSSSSSSAFGHDRPHGTDTEDATIPRLRKALRAVDSKMAALARERARLVGALEHASRARAPVRRLPRELLAHVFRAAGEDALLLGSVLRVCRDWHAVAVGTPALWTALALGPHSPLGAAQSRLARTKDAPLDVQVDLREQPGLGTPVDAVAAMKMLGPTVGRWRSFT